MHRAVWVLALLAVLGSVRGPLVARAEPAATDSVADEGVWPNGARCAVSLTYDDSLAVHHRAVAPLLDAHGLRGTLYLSIHNLQDFDAWKGVAARGHELGNHSLFHPCHRDPPERSAWLAEEYDLAHSWSGWDRNVRRSGRHPWWMWPGTSKPGSDRPPAWRTPACRPRSQAR